MRRENTGLKDRRGSDVFVGDNVWIEGELYEIQINYIDGSYVADGDLLGQEKLEKVTHKCTKA